MNGKMEAGVGEGCAGFGFGFLGGSAFSFRHFRLPFSRPLPLINQPLSSTPLPP